MNKTVISNDCFGGVLSYANHMQFCSPTIKLQILPEEFPKFCGNLRHYMETPLVRYIDISEEHKQYLVHMYGFIPSDMPIGLVDDVMIIFQHYETFEEAKEKWDKRKARVDYNSICYLFHLKNESYAEYGRQFLALGLPNSEVITEDFTLEGCHRFDVPKGLDCFSSVGGIRVIEQNFSVKKFLGLEE